MAAYLLRNAMLLVAIRAKQREQTQLTLGHSQGRSTYFFLRELTLSISGAPINNKRFILFRRLRVYHQFQDHGVLPDEVERPYLLVESLVRLPASLESLPRHGFATSSLRRLNLLDTLIAHVSNRAIQLGPLERI